MAATSAQIEELVDDIRCLARRMVWRHQLQIDVQDAEQAALEGLCQAARRWDPAGGPFAPYARVRACGAIIDEMRRMRPSKGLPGHGYGRHDPRAWDRPVSTDAHRTADGCTLADLLPATGEDDDVTDWLLDVARHAWRLSARERQVLWETAAGGRLWEVAAQWGVSEGRACQVRSDAARKLRVWAGEAA